MDHQPQFLLNGQRYDLGDCDGSESLLRWLKRQQLHGTKEVCADGDCGACTVVMQLTDEQGEPQWQAVNSCLLPVGCLAGRELLTVEALADGDRLHPVQQALVDCAGSQCGYCTPGFVMSLFAAHTAGQLDEACFEGNLCRCTGYLPIRRALKRLYESPPLPPGTKPAAGDPLPVIGSAHWQIPVDLDSALRMKQADPEAQWIAGGTDLGVQLSHGRGNASRYIGLDRVDGLQQLQISDAQVRIGAAVPLHRLEQQLAGLFPPLDQMLPWFAARQVRNRATLGGNLGTASPIGDLLPILLALDATVHCRSLSGARDIPIDQFFLGYRQTALKTDELIEAVTLPRRSDWQCAAYKVAKRQTDDISIVAAVFALKLDAEKRVLDCRLAFGGVAAIPLRAGEAEQALRGRVLDQDCVARVTQSLAESFTPLSDLRAGADYRRALCANLFAKFVREKVQAVGAAA